MNSSATPTVAAPQSDGPSLPYDAVIRTDHANALLERCIAALRKQSKSPRRIFIVDSSLDSLCRERLLELSDFVIQYPAIPFSFAHALNLGIEAAEGIQVLLLSSHVILSDRTLIEEGQNLGKRHDAEVVYWRPTAFRSQRFRSPMRRHLMATTPSPQSVHSYRGRRSSPDPSEPKFSQQKIRNGRVGICEPRLDGHCRSNIHILSISIQKRIFKNQSMKRFPSPFSRIEIFSARGILRCASFARV